MNSRTIPLLLIAAFHLAYGWDTFFNFSPCYQKRMEDRMPLSMDNLIALIEKYERINYNTAPEDIANAILLRYRKNGVVYQPNAQVKWSTYQDFEIYKQDLDDKLLKPSFTITRDAFIPREECSLHMSVSHSVDVYPFAGVDNVWDNSGGFFGRKRRAVTSSGSSSNYYGFDSSSGVATHPIENGVVQTPDGPIAVGLLLSGIMSMGSQASYTVSELVGKDAADSYMPNDMKTKRVDRLYGATLSGELAQAAILTGKKDDKTSFDVGPLGRFGNSTACPRSFSLEKFYENTFLTRAEIYASVDALIISKMAASSTTGVKLSQLLRMYYGKHGVNNNQVKACNRKNLFNYAKNEYMNVIEENALNYMYAYQNYFPDLRNAVAQSSDDFAKIETMFKSYLDPVLRSVFSFLSSPPTNKPYNQECVPMSDSKEYQIESLTDLVVVYTPIGSYADAEQQAEYIALTARQLGIGYDRSRMAVYNGRTMNWISPMTNYSNIADYSCNYTTFTPYGTASTQEFVKVMDELSKFYFEIYNYLTLNPNENAKRSQVVMWNLPNSFSDSQEDMLNSWIQFNATYPDVNFVFVGEKPNYLKDVFINENDVSFVSLSKDPEATAIDLANVIKTAPRMFFYAACDTRDPQFDNYDENRHVYISYVSPNFTSLIRIPPQNFKYSEILKLKFKSSDIMVCMSRVDRIPSKDYPTTSECHDATTEFEYKYLCDYIVEECDPIYIAVTGNANSRKACTKKECQFPNQIEFEMTHEGMICGCWNLVPSTLLLLITIFATFFRF